MAKQAMTLQQQIAYYESLGGVLSAPVRIDYSDTAKPVKSEQKPTLVEPGIAIEPTRLTILVAHATKNELNERKWRAKNRRAGEAWRRVREAMGPHLGALEPYARHYAQGGALRVTFTRLGGRHLDQLCNLGGALKGVEDAVAFILGADDRDPRWHPAAEQVCGGPVGVKVEISEWTL